MQLVAKIVSDAKELRTAKAQKVSGKIGIKPGDYVALSLTPSEVSGYTREGADLIVHLKNGETLRIADFYGSDDHKSHLYLVDDNDQLLAADFVTSPDGVLTAAYTAEGTSAEFASIGPLVAAAAGGGGLGAGAIAGGGLLAAGAAAAAAGGGGGDSGGTPAPTPTPTPTPTADTTPPGAATGLAFNANGTQLSGNGEPGATARIDVNGDGVADYTAAIGADGHFTVALNPPLANAQHVSVTVSDAAGNVSPAATATAPDLTPPQPATDVQVSGDGATVTGHGEPGATVQVDTNGDGTPDATSTVGTDGSFTVPINPPLTNGQTVEVTVTDGAGNESTPVTATAPDTTPPAPATGVTVTPDGTAVTGSAEPGASVGVDTNGDGTPDTSVTAGPDGSFTAPLDPPLTNGETVRVTVTDGAGNESTPVTATAPDLLPPPPAPVLDPSNGTEISGTALPGSTVSVTDASGNVIGTDVADGSGNWSVTPASPLADGTVVTATASNSEGEAGPAASVTVDAVAPAAPTIMPTDGNPIAGTAEPGSVVTLTDGSGNPIGTATADVAGNWSVTPAAPLADGTVVNATATDAAGNTSPPASTVVDGAAPAAPAIDPTNGTEVSGTAEPGATVTLTDGAGNVIGTDVADGSGNWSVTPAAPLANGTTVSATATDAAGNTSAPDTETVDAVAPGTPMIAPTDGSPVTGTAEPNTSVTLTDGAGNVIATGIAVDGAGNWSYTPATPIADGTTVNATAADAAGNVSAPATTVVDAAAPAAPVIAPTDGTEVSGTAEPGATVTLTDASGNVIGADVADGSGNWSVTPAAPLADGTTVSATATDAAGNTSAPDSETVDAVAPAAPVLDPTNGTQISGTAEPGATVTVTDGSGNVIGTDVADGSGNWSVTPAAPLADGTVVNATATDPAGNTSAPDSETVDAVAPAAPVIAPTDGSPVTGTAEPNTSVTLTDGAGNVIASGIPVDGSGNWSYTPVSPLANGTIVNATATDAAGNTSAPDTETVDAAAPPAPTIAPTDGSPVTGTAEPNTSITLTDGAGAVIASGIPVDGAGNWTYTPASPLADGVTVHATATDAAGNVSAPATAVVDAVAPAAPVIAPTDGTEVSGTAEPGATVTVTDASGNVIGTDVADGSGNWSVTPAAPLADGTTVSATATDPAGNTSGPDTETVDAVAPAAPVIAPTDGAAVSGTAEPGATVTVTDASGNVIGADVADGAGNWAVTPASPLADGTVVSATATDAAGNTSGPDTETVDASAPAAPVIAPTNGTEVSGTAEAGATVTVTDGSGNLIGTDVADGSGNWSVTPASPLADGTVVSATQTDAAGNVSGPDTETVDAVAPGAPVIAPTNGTEVSGTAEPGATVTVTDGSGTVIGTDVADGSGNWSVTPGTPLADGTTVSATATDAAGNISGPDTETVDALAPTAPVLDPSNGTVLEGTAEPGATVTLTQADGTPIGTATADGSGNWAFTPVTPLPDGTQVNATATDAAGNTSGPASTTVDSAPPAAPTIDPSNGSVITGGSEPGADILIVYANGTPIGQATADGAGDWTFTPATPLPDGTVLEVRAVDPAGNVSAPAATTVDAVAPPAPVIAPTNGTEVSGTAEPGATVTVTDGLGNPVGTDVADGSGNWSVTPGSPLADGTVVSATASDAAGNVSPPDTETVDAIAPAAPVIAPTNGAELVGTAEPGSTVTVTDSLGNVIGTDVADAGGNWSVTPASPLTDGTVVSATATDAAGNTSGPGTETVDASLPSIPVIDPTNGTEIVGTADAGNTITLTADGTQIATGILVDGSGNWSYTPGAQLPDGTVVTAVATNGLGTDSAAATEIVDGIAPAAPVIDPTNGTEIVGTAEAGATVTVTDSLGNVIGTDVADASGNWSVTPASPLADGTVVSATATDPAGNTSGPDTETVDAVAPGTPTIDPTDGVALTGTAEPGATVTLTDGSGNPIGTTTAAPDGSWAFAPATPLADGTVVNATATDPAGNSSGPASTTVDAVAPDAPVIGIANANSVIGTAEPGATVTVTDTAGNVIGTDVADGSGNWSITPATPLADGTVLSATASDPAGNISPPDSAIVDALPPAAPVIAPTDGSPVAGTAEPNSTVTLTDGSGNVIATGVPVNGTGHWSYTPASPLADGTVVSATATDANGNTGPAATATVDGVAPLAPTIAPTDGSPVTGTAEPNSSVTLTDGAGTVIAAGIPVDGTGHWSYTPGTPLANGTVVNATATDAAGNTGPAATATVDSSAPPAPVISPTAGTEVSGTAEAGATVTVRDGAGNVIGTDVADGLGNWSVTPAAPLSNGTVVRATATDAAGNTSPADAETVDAGAPVATVPEAGDGWVNGAEAANGVQVQVALQPNTNAGDSVTVTYNGTAQAPVAVTAADLANGFVTVTVPAASLAQGAGSVTAAINGGTVSAATGFTVDTIAPTVAITAVDDGVAGIVGNVANGGLTNDATPTLHGTSSTLNGQVAIYQDGVLVGTVPTDASGNWTYQAPTLADGTHSFEVRSTDAAGNTGSSGTYSVQVDATAPGAPIADVTDATGATVTGTGEAGAHVIVYAADGTTVLGQGNVAGDGTYTVTLATPQTNGETVVVTQTDLAGNTSLPTTVGAPDLVALVNDIGDASIDLSVPSSNMAAVNASYLVGVAALGDLVDLQLLGTPTANFSVANGHQLDAVFSYNALINLGALSGFHIVVQELIDGQWVGVGGDSNYSLLTVGLLNGDVVASMTLDGGTYRAFMASDTSVLDANLLGSLTVNGVDHNYTLPPTSTAIAVNGDLLANDTAPVGAVVQSVTFNGVTTPVDADGETINGQYGTLTVHADGSYTYTPANNPANIGQAETFQYTVSSSAGTESANLYIHVGSPDATLIWDPAAPGSDAVAPAAAADDSGTAAILDPTYNSTASQNYPNLVANGNIVGVGTVSASTNVGFTVESNATSSTTLHLQVTNATGLGAGVLPTYTVTVTNSGGVVVYTTSQTALLTTGITAADITIPGQLASGAYNVAITASEAVAGVGGVSFTTAISLQQNVTHLNQFTSHSVEGNLLANDAQSVPFADLAVGHGTTLTPMDADGVQVAGTYGTLTVYADGSYHYQPNAVLSYDPAAPANLHDVFDYSLAYPGGTAGAQLDITIEVPGTTVNGTAGADVLNASSASGSQLYGFGGADTLNGGAGGDLLDGGAGADTLHGNGGNDRLIYDALDTLVDGGAGIDVLQINTATALLDGSTNVHNIERIDLGTNDGGHALTLTTDGVLAVTGTDPLVISGDAEDRVTMMTANLQGQTVSEGHVYDVYSFGTSTIWVEDSVQVVTQ
ncbi:MAG: BapA prefix-like domain-containing protein [Sphingomonas sp.]|uniref:BapA/Bap/LapF family large adhesin n=1 Tax=Sphingomonas sp. TaxID=28214 RepID=UPI001B13E9E8|nr:BapA/Bap/LapF family large adhesin [Sphingomonas sp.]MBO9624080.1 BapA prefix-like domain-containing protein [Sphingomonas sp.]